MMGRGMPISHNSPERMEVLRQNRHDNVAARLGLHLF